MVGRIEFGLASRKSGSVQFLQGRRPLPRYVGRPHDLHNEAGSAGSDASGWYKEEHEALKEESIRARSPRAINPEHDTPSIRDFLQFLIVLIAVDQIHFRELMKN